MRALFKTLLLASALIAPSIATAQNFPTAPVTIVVPFPPGGTNDLIGRYLADRLKELWKQSVVVENRPGAGSAIGVAHVTRAKPDGYTLLFNSNSFTTMAATQKNLPFDPVKDVQPVGMAAVGDQFILTGTRVSLPTLQEIQKQAKAMKIFYGTTGANTSPHLAGELLNDILGVKMEAVHYQGGAAALTDLGGGRVDINFGTANEVNRGVGKNVAVMSEKRSAAFPQVPTVGEAGFPAALFPWWGGVFAPPNTPKDVLAKINQDVFTVMSSKEGAEFLTQQGFTAPAKMSVEEFTNLVTREIKDWGALAEKHGMVVK